MGKIWQFNPGCPCVNCCTGDDYVFVLPYDSDPPSPNDCLGQYCAVDMFNCICNNYPSSPPNSDNEYKLYKQMGVASPYWLFYSNLTACSPGKYNWILVKFYSPFPNDPRSDFGFGLNFCQLQLSTWNSINAWVGSATAPDFDLQLMYYAYNGSSSNPAHNVSGKVFVSR